MNAQSTTTPRNVNLTELARKARKFDTEFTETLREEGTRNLNAAEDLLVVNHTTDVESGMAVVTELRDLRSSLMTVYDRSIKDSKANLFQAEEYAGKLDTEGGLKEPESKKLDQHRRLNSFDTVTREYEAETAGVEVREHEPRGLTGIGKFIQDLTQVISVATAAAALPPGPMAVSVGSFAREDSSSSADSRFSGRLDGGSWGLLSGGHIEGSVSGTSHSESNYKKVSTDERMLAMIDDLRLRLDQMGVHDEVPLEVRGERHFKDIGFKDRKIFSDRIEVVGSSRNYRGTPEFRTLEERPHIVSHPKIPNSGMENYRG